jgi:hypothetical protein
VEALEDRTLPSAGALGVVAALNLPPAEAALVRDMLTDPAQLGHVVTQALHTAGVSAGTVAAAGGLSGEVQLLESLGPSVEALPLPEAPLIVVFALTHENVAPRGAPTAPRVGPSGRPTGHGKASPKAVAQEAAAHSQLDPKVSQAEPGPPPTTAGQGEDPALEETDAFAVRDEVEPRDDGGLGGFDLFRGLEEDPDWPAYPEPAPRPAERLGRVFADLAAQVAALAPSADDAPGPFCGPAMALGEGAVRLTAEPAGAAGDQGPAPPPPGPLAGQWLPRGRGLLPCEAGMAALAAGALVCVPAANLERPRKKRFRHGPGS